MRQTPTDLPPRRVLDALTNPLGILFQCRVWLRRSGESSGCSWSRDHTYHSKVPVHSDSCDSPFSGNPKQKDGFLTLEEWIPLGSLISRSALPKMVLNHSLFPLGYCTAGSATVGVEIGLQSVQLGLFITKTWQWYQDGKGFAKFISDRGKIKTDMKTSKTLSKQSWNNCFVLLSIANICLIILWEPVD